MKHCQYKDGSEWKISTFNEKIQQWPFDSCGQNYSEKYLELFVNGMANRPSKCFLIFNLFDSFVTFMIKQTYGHADFKLF